MHRRRLMQDGLVASAGLLAGLRSLGAEEEAALRVALLSGSAEYKSDESLAAWGKSLEKRYGMESVRCFGKDKGTDLPGLESLPTCDVMVLFTRRMTLPPKQLERVKAFIASGKPVLGIRTASHAFQNWPELDREIFGGDYRGHYPPGPPVQVSIGRRGAQHPITASIGPFTATGSLYQNPEVARDAEVLLAASIPGHTEPVAWVRTRKTQRIFYTSLGHPADFRTPEFKQILQNALFWCLHRTPPKG